MDNEKFGQFISEIKKERGMTQAENRKTERRNIMIIVLIVLVLFLLLLVLDYIPMLSLVITFLPFASLVIGICLFIMSILRFIRKETYGLTLFCAFLAILYPILMVSLVIYGFLHGALIGS